MARSVNRKAQCHHGPRSLLQRIFFPWKRHKDLKAVEKCGLARLDSIWGQNILPPIHRIPRTCANIVGNLEHALIYRTFDVGGTPGHVQEA